MQLLRETFTALDENPQCRVIVLTGAGKAFSAGFDMKETPLHDNPVTAMAAQELFGGTPSIIRRTRQPVIVAIPGATVGAGFALALAADIRIASKSARFLNGAVKIGLSAGESGMSYHLPRLIGAARAFEIMLTGRAVGADEALAIGLVSQLVEREELMDAALKIAADIAANSPFAMQRTKRLMWDNLEAPSLDAALELENNVQTVAMMTEDFREGVNAFLEKRKPQFRNR
jgi:enoyl-CoA hydratase